VALFTREIQNKRREALITLNNQEELGLCLKLEWRAISLKN